MPTVRNRKIKNKTAKKCNTEIPSEFKNITASINVSALKRNLEYLKKKSGTDVMPVLKANAYGHGIVEIAKICRSFGVNYIGVATIGEAIQIRNSGDKGKILAWLYDVNGNQVRDAASRDIDVGIFDETHIPIISKSLPPDEKASVHLFVDTGIDRNGIPYERAIDAAKTIIGDPKFNLVGVMSHLCCAKSKRNPATIKQFELFRKLRADLAELNIKPQLFHISATDGILNYDNSDFEMVRSGAGFYGLDSSQDKHLTQAFNLTSKIVQLKRIPKGAAVGYDRTYISQKPERIAIVPIGYADLLPIIPHEKMRVIVNGTKRKVLGLESMDQIVVQAKPEDKLGDEVRIFGDKKHGFISAVDFSKQSGTTASNIITHLGNRVNVEFVK